MDTKTVIIIGPGKVGSSLFLAMRKNSALRTYLAGNKALTPELARLVPEESYIQLGKKIYTQRPDVVVFTVPDDVIKTAAGALLPFCESCSLAVHTSGAFDSSQLDILKSMGIQTGSWHPLQTFTKILLPPSIWQGITTTFEGDEEAELFISDLCRYLGCRLIPIDKRQKLAVHVASVFAANFLPALFSAGWSVLKKEDFSREQSKQLLLPLMRRSLYNIQENPPEEALSGPLQRGDRGTLQRHLDFLQQGEATKLAELYRLLSKLLAEDKQFSITDREQVLRWLEKKL